MAMPKLAVLEFIRDFIDRKRYPPTIREIADGCDISSTSMTTHYLNQLEEEGKISRERYISRGIVLRDQ